jgi:hypothetical protein
MAMLHTNLAGTSAWHPLQVDKLVAAKPGSFDKESIFRWVSTCVRW